MTSVNEILPSAVINRLSKLKYASPHNSKVAYITGVQQACLGAPVLSTT